MHGTIRDTDRPDARTPPATIAAARSAITASIEARAERLVRFRRRLHATPEPSGEEHATTTLVADALTENGLHPRIMADGVGVVVDVDLGAPGHSSVAVRSELDCVQVNDDKQEPYASTRPGLCHACGHDVHSTIVLATVLTLAELRRQGALPPVRHNLRAIFQPAEETALGARAMIKQGALDGVDAILALHVEPFLDAGVVGLRRGAMTSACKSFQIRIRGRSGHSARPHEALDPIPAATNLVSLLYQLCPRSLDARRPLSLTVASIAAGHSFNAIPDEAEIRGTLRTARSEDMDAVQQRVDAVIRSVAEATGCDVHLHYPHYTPPTDNDDRVLDVIGRTATELLGPGAVRWLEQTSLGAEDFGFYQELIPGAIVRLGTGFTDGRPRRPLHSSLFDVDESALTVGAAFLGAAALDLAAGRLQPLA